MSYWENKNVLITGATGFVGRHLFDKLTSLGAKVYGISKTKEEKNIFKVNIVNYKALDDIFKKKKINMCFHLAAEALVESGQDNPYNTFKTNLEGTLNILELARKYELDKIVIASSSHVYGANKVPYIEEYVPRPSRPYETSKTCTDLIAQSYADSFNLPVLIPRFVNIYGPGDTNFNRLIPKTIKSVVKNTNPGMWGGKAIRDYMYIDDAVSAYISLGKLDKKRMEKNRIYNFGSGDIISVKDLIQKIIDLSGNELSIDKLKDERSDEINEQYLSYKKATRILGWKPKHSLDQGLKKTIKWYKDYLKQ